MNRNTFTVHETCECYDGRMLSGEILPVEERLGHVDSIFYTCCMLYCMYVFMYLCKKVKRRSCIWSFGHYFYHI